MDSAFYVTTCWHFCPSKEPCCHWPSFLRLQIRWQGWFCPHHSSTPREKEMGPRAVCRADHSIAAEPSRQSEVLGLGTWRPSKSIGPCRHSRRLPSGPSCTPTSGAARQLPPSTARGVGAAVGRARSLPSSRPRRVSSGAQSSARRWDGGALLAMAPGLRGLPRRGLWLLLGE